jgi:hypothetical protein
MTRMLIQLTNRFIRVPSRDKAVISTHRLFSHTIEYTHFNYARKSFNTTILLLALVSYFAFWEPLLIFYGLHKGSEC